MKKQSEKIIKLVIFPPPITRLLIFYFERNKNSIIN